MVSVWLGGENWLPGVEVGGWVESTIFLVESLPLPRAIIVRAPDQEDWPFPR